MYVDPTTGEWVAEYETRNSAGEVTRRTEWFKDKSDAKRFTRTGVMPQEKNDRS